jgi:predicted DNA-binding transcriptional regulator AlpA
MPKILTARDIAKILGVCERYVSEHLSLRAGFPDRLDIPGRKRWLESEILDWIETKRLRKAA